MTGHTTMAVGVAGTIAAGLAGGPIAEVFNELGLALGLMGALGGITLGIANRYPWRGAVRSSFLGGFLAFGFGVISPPILSAMFGIDVATGSVPAMAAGAFAIGFTQEIVIEWLRKKGANQ